jgi:hypothetical protein
MRQLCSVGFLTSAFVGIGAAVACAAPLAPSAIPVVSTSHVQKVGCRHDCGRRHHHRQEVYGWRERTFIARDFDRPRVYYPWVYSRGWDRGDYRFAREYCDRPRVYGVIEERFVILGSGVHYYPRDRRGYLRHW